MPKADPRRAFAASVVIVVGLLCATNVRADQGPSRWREVPVMAYDLLLIRPLGLASLAAGAGFFAIAAPLTAPFGDVGGTWERFVELPFRFTFRRSLGNLDDF